LGLLLHPEVASSRLSHKPTREAAANNKVAVTQTVATRFRPHRHPKVAMPRFRLGLPQDQMAVSHHHQGTKARAMTKATSALSSIHQSAAQSPVALEHRQAEILNPARSEKP
jgi:hypothetical protein